MSDAVLRRPPLTFRLPASTGAAPGGRARPRARLARPAGLLMYVTTLGLVVVNERFRGVEAALVRPVAEFLTGRHHSVAAGSIVYFALGTRRAFGLQVTAECTSALLLVPLLVMMGSFAVFTRIPLRRQLAALGLGAALIVGVNVLRVAGIAWATWRFGYDPGYTLSHVFVGSAFSLVGFVGAMLSALWVLVRAERVPLTAVHRTEPARPRPGPGVPRHRPRPGTAMSFELDWPPGE